MHVFIIDVGVGLQDYCYGVHVFIIDVGVGL